MPMNVEKLRKLVALDESDPLSRFALGQALSQDGTPEALTEAADHLTVANEKDPNHLATYHVLAQVLIALDRKDDARSVLKAGCEKVRGVGEGMGRDLGPVLEEMLQSIS